MLQLSPFNQPVRESKRDGKRGIDSFEYGLRDRSHLRETVVFPPGVVCRNLRGVGGETVRSVADRRVPRFACFMYRTNLHANANEVIPARGTVLDRRGVHWKSSRWMYDRAAEVW